MKRICVQSESGLNRMCERLEKHKEIGLDYETRPGWWVTRPDLAGVGVAVHEDSEYVGWYCPTGHDIGLLDKQNLPEELVLSKLKPILENQKILKVAHGGEIESGLSKVYGIELGDSIRCSQIATWLVDEETWLSNPRALRLKEIVPQILGRPIKTAEEHMGGKVKDYGTIPIDVMTVYNTDDSIHGLMLHEWMEPEMKRQNVMGDYLNVEIPLIKVLCDMVIRGVQIDMNETMRVLAGVTKRQQELEGFMCKEAGRPVSPGQRQVIASIIIDELGYPEMMVSQSQGRGKEPLMVPYRTATGKYKTDDPAMQHYAKLGCPIAKHFVEWGDLDKKRGTDLMKFVDGVGEDGRFHPKMWQPGTKTGRFSGNLQQVPRDALHVKLIDMVCEDDTWHGESFTEFDIDIRRLVIPRPGTHMIVADFNQLELRLIAHFSRDPSLVYAYEHGLDLHTETANALNIDRPGGKVVNFALAYGLSLFTLIEEFGEEKAREVWPLLRERYKVLRRYTGAIHKFTHDHEFVTTLFGRRRHLPHINTGDAYMRGHAERQAFNSRIQGTAADVVKWAQILLAKAVPEFHQVLQIHDELIGEVEGTKKFALQVMEAVKYVMESAVRLTVPLLVNPKLALNWREGKG
jgi:DNA polymerase-1